MEDGVCKASLDTLSQGLGVDRATVMRHAAALVEDGYLKDLTPDLRNRPHVYADTGKASIRIGIGATVAQRNVTVAECNTAVAQRNVTVAESQLNKDSKRLSKKDHQERVTPAHILQAVDQYLHIRFNGTYSKVNPRTSVDEKPNRVTVRVSIDQPDLEQGIQQALSAITRKRFAVKIEVDDPVKDSSDPLLALHQFHDDLVGSACFYSNFDDKALLFCASKYTPDQYTATYRRIKLDKFWANKPVTPETVAKHIAETGATHAIVSQSPAPVYTDAQRAAAEAINAANRARRAQAGL